MNDSTFSRMLRQFQDFPAGAAFTSEVQKAVGWWVSLNSVLDRAATATIPDILGGVPAGRLPPSAQVAVAPRWLLTAVRSPRGALSRPQRRSSQGGRPKAAHWQVALDEQAVDCQSSWW